MNRKTTEGQQRESQEGGGFDLELAHQQQQQAELAEHQAELERADAAALVLRLNSDGRPGGETTAHV